MAGSHEQLTHVLLGANWSPASDLIPFLAISTLGVMSGHLFGVFLESTRHFREKVRIQAVSSAVLLLAMLAGSTFGAIGAVIGMAAASLVFWGLYVLSSSQVIEISAGSIVSWLLPGLGAGLICGVYSAGLPLYLSDLAPSSILALQISGCGALTLSYYATFHRKLLRELADLVLVRRR
jgi:O-antigen/teichoic acid export membrane protein